jgi:hypothetical protein
MQNTLNIEKTDEYSIFNTLTSNRVVNKKHVKVLKESLSETQIPVPIIVNEQMEVIDGQHRLQAIKELGLEVYYITIPGLGLPDVIRLNHDAKNWTLRDYIEAYVAEGKENYQTLIDWDLRYSNLHIQKIIAILQDRQYGEVSKKAIERGNWVIPADRNLEEAAAMASTMDQMHDAFKPFMRINTHDFNSMFQLVKSNDIDLIKFIEKIEAIHSVESDPDIPAKDKPKPALLFLVKAFKESQSIDSTIRKAKAWFSKHSTVQRELVEL